MDDETKKFIEDTVANAVAANNDPDKDNKEGFQILTYAQYAFLGLAGATFMFLMVYGIYHADDLANFEMTRGLISYLFVVATVAIAIMLLLTAILTRPDVLDKRFAVGKEVLTVMVGLLGAIIGFYFGAGNTGNSQQTIRAASVVISPKSLKPDSKDQTVTISTALVGGVAPYSYTVKSDDAKLLKVPSELKTTENGEISFEATVMAGASGDIGFQIDGKDSKGTAFNVNKDGKYKVKIGATTTTTSPAPTP